MNRVRSAALAGILICAPASAQTNLSGVWNNFPLFHEDEPDRLPGPELGDYTGNSGHRRERSIRMDGRPHPGPDAMHTAMGFSTGTWEGDILAVRTTHLKEGRIRRNGITRSDRATVTGHFIRHGNVLTLMTSRLLPGNLQSNGAPYSANVTMVENVDVVKSDDEEWLVIDTIVTAPTCLFRTFVRSTHFKNEADGSEWDPRPCIVRW
jgi:hypothetical protein